MERVYKPFCKAINLTAGGASTEVVLEDTRGTNLECNFLRVDLAAATDASGFVHVEPSGSNTYYADATVDPSATTTSGSGGFLVRGTGPIEVAFPQAQAARTVFLTNYYDVGVTVLLTYGVKLAFNPLRGKELDQGS